MPKGMGYGKKMGGGKKSGGGGSGAPSGKSYAGNVKGSRLGKRKGTKK